MARPLRFAYKGALYHVHARGNERRKIFFTDTDYQKFKDYIAGAIEKYHCLVHCYVLMGNHYHLIIETPEANISKVMHYISGSYTTYINIKRGRNGHLFQGRYKSILVDKDPYLMELSRYIHLNPVRAKMVEKPEEYAYSSYNSYITGKPEKIVTTDLILEMLSRQRKEAQNEYRGYVENGIGEALKNPLDNAYGGIILGGERFIKSVLRTIKEGYTVRAEVSHRKALRNEIVMEEIIEGVCRYFKVTREAVVKRQRGDIKNIAIYLIKRHTGATNNEIGELFEGVSYSAVSKTYQRMLERLQADRELRKKVEKADASMSNVKG